MDSCWYLFSSSKETSDKGKNEMEGSSSEPTLNVNLVDDLACYNFGEYRTTDMEFSQEAFPPCPSSFENLNPTSRQQENTE